MFYKFLKDGRRQLIDIRNLYEDGTLFLLAGSPKITEEPLDLLDQSGVVTMGINNSPSIFRPQLWVSGDRPSCFAEGIVKDPGMIKFINYSRRDQQVNGIPWKYYPSTLFYPSTQKFKEGLFLEPGNQMAWWHSTWWIALQLAWKLGFRTVYMLGAEFRVGNQMYAWDAKLSEKERKSNARLYHHEAKKMNKLKPMFDKYGLNLYNCCKSSALTDKYGYMSLKEAIDHTCSGMSMDTKNLPHSSNKGK